MREERRAMWRRAAYAGPLVLAMLGTWPCWADEPAPQNPSESPDASSSVTPEPSAASEQDASASVEVPAPSTTASPSASESAAPPPSPSPSPSPSATLQPATAPVPPLTFEPKTTADTLARIGIIGGAAVTFAGLLLMADASAQQGKLDAACISHPSTGDSTCPRSQQDRIDRYHTEFLGGGIATLSGLVFMGIGFAIYKLVLPPRPDPPAAWNRTPAPPTPIGGRF